MRFQQASLLLAGANVAQQRHHALPSLVLTNHIFYHTRGKQQVELAGSNSTESATTSRRISTVRPPWRPLHTLPARDHQRQPRPRHHRGGLAASSFFTYLEDTINCPISRSRRLLPYRIHSGWLELTVAPIYGFTGSVIKYQPHLLARRPIKLFLPAKFLQASPEKILTIRSRTESPSFALIGLTTHCSTTSIASSASRRFQHYPLTWAPSPTHLRRYYHISPSTDLKRKHSTVLAWTLRVERQIPRREPR